MHEENICVGVACDIQVVFKQGSINKFNGKHQFRPHLYVICFAQDTRGFLFTHFSCAKIKAPNIVRFTNQEHTYMYLIEINIRTVIAFCSFSCLDEER